MIDATEVLNDRGALILPNPTKKELLLLGWMTVRKGTTGEPGGVELENERDSTRETD